MSKLKASTKVHSATRDSAMAWSWKSWGTIGRIIMKSLKGCGANRRVSSSVEACGYWSVNGRVGRWLRDKGRLLNGNWLVSDCFTTTSGGAPAPSFLLPHNYLIIEHWLVNTESWFLVWYLGPSEWLNLGRMMDYMGRWGTRIFANLFFFPMSSSAETRRAVSVKNYRAHNSWRSHMWPFKLSRGGEEKENFIIPITCTRS